MYIFTGHDIFSPFITRICFVFKCQSAEVFFPLAVWIYFLFHLLLGQEDMGSRQTAKSDAKNLLCWTFNWYVIQNQVMLIIQNRRRECSDDDENNNSNYKVQLAHSFLFCSCVYFSLYCPFNRISFHKFSGHLSVLRLFFWSYLCLIGPLNYIIISFYDSLIISFYDSLMISFYDSIMISFYDSKIISFYDSLIISFYDSLFQPWYNP